MVAERECDLGALTKSEDVHLQTGETCRIRWLPGLAGSAWTSL